MAVSDKWSGGLLPSLTHRLCLLSGSFFHRVSLLTDPRSSHYIFFFFLNLPVFFLPRPVFIACTLSRMKSGGQRSSISLHVCDCYRWCQSCVGDAPLLRKGLLSARTDKRCIVCNLCLPVSIDYIVHLQRGVHHSKLKRANWIKVHHVSAWPGRY